MNGKNVDYRHPGSQARVVSMLARNLRGGAASSYHRRIMIDNEPISSIDEFEVALREEFISPDQQAPLTSCPTSL
ncbi:hypothetical protein GN958_ATG13311 [Phytophthora infestans]|uniref:Uncharacterized protein n=1 Tax=Phytophthora infestans TaxID=4787 RepID=A0A8S9UD92_PHYIN|nr:hypothetical protein GN958_ATG13311 [Phytophthora infestans]